MAVALRESQNRVESMALIHEQLYETADLRVVDLAEHAALLAQNLYRSYGEPSGVELRVEIENLPLGIDRAIPASLILNELVSNAFKHGFPNGRAGTITLHGRRREGSFELAVEDDGAGVPEEIGWKKPKSLGLEIVHILTRQLKGTFELDRSHGTAFRVWFPLG